MQKGLARVFVDERLAQIKKRAMVSTVTPLIAGGAELSQWLEIIVFLIFYHFGGCFSTRWSQKPGRILRLAAS